MKKEVRDVEDSLNRTTSLVYDAVPIRQERVVIETLLWHYFLNW